MTVVAFTIVNPNPGVKWEDLQKLIKKGCDLARKHDAENFTVLVMTLGGRATNTIGVLSSAVDWGGYAKIQRALLEDPEMQAVLQEGGQLATWESYLSQTIPGM